MRRREFIKRLAGTASLAALSSCSRTLPVGRAAGKRMLVLAFDGLDPRVLESLMRAGRTPHFAQLAPDSSVVRLATTTPPQTPVAFSSIICGCDPGRHQIFDFIHRDPRPHGTAAVHPYFSVADASTSEQNWCVPLGNWRLPLSGGEVRLMRRGTPFWDYLAAAGIDVDLYYLPANYPPRSTKATGSFRSMSGMGTPDILGGYGEFTVFAPDVPRMGRSVGGGRFVRLSMIDHHGHAQLSGPPDFLKSPDAGESTEPLAIPLDVVRDSEQAVAKISIQEQRLVLSEGEWSEWVPLEFTSQIPGGEVMAGVGVATAVPGMVRFYLKSVHPKLVLYCSPINIDPLKLASPISEPPEFAEELARRHGRFHTVGIPEDTKALSHGALNEDEFLAQAGAAMAERREQFSEALKQHRQGCLFFYFGASDLLQHMFWRDRDPDHPGWDATQADRYEHVVDDVYIEADQILGEALNGMREDDALLVLSDHGFTTFRRGFNVNSWLLERGYVAIPDSVPSGQGDLLANVMWKGTRAYGLGMNSLYLNLAGREKQGIVRAADQRGLLDEIKGKLLEFRDVDDSRVFHRVDVVADLYPQADPQVAPDIILGYSDAYNASWETVLGGMPQDLVVDNLDRWSGTHLISPDLVPGILFSNRPIMVEQPSVMDVAPTILGAFGLTIPHHMQGRNLLA
jgi:predicted AlkP superfamily phosphohydrolase/phosphomutase